MIIPLSFNAEPFFTFPMPAVSTRWYEDLFASRDWRHAIETSFIVALSVMVLATILGTLAAIGLTWADFRFKPLVIGLLLSPMMMPHVIIGVGLFLFYAQIGIVYTRWGLILAHTALAAPFVVLTVSATLANFDVNLIRAGANLGARPVTVFFRIVLPLILPGLLAGAILAFVASFDELIVAIMISGSEYRTIPRQMWSGAREEISPVILSAATLMVSVSILVPGSMEWLRRQAERRVATSAARSAEPRRDGRRNEMLARR